MYTLQYIYKACITGAEPTKIPALDHKWSIHTQNTYTHTYLASIRTTSPQHYSELKPTVYILSRPQLGVAI